MSQKKKLIRKQFRDQSFSRDNYSCVMCKFKSSLEKALEDLDCHHIKDRTLMPNGGYVKENGITLCKSCHELAEVWHGSNHETFHPGYHSDDLYKKIKSSEALAIRKSKGLS